MTYLSLTVNNRSDPRLGYTYQPGSANYETGYYATGDKLKYDVQDPSAADRGLVVAMRNVYNNESTVEYDAYDLLPVKVTDALGMEVTSENDYRVLSPLQMTDPNENVTKVAFNALGLVSKIALCGKDNGANGDTLAVPGTSFAYDFFAFVNDSDPISVRKTGVKIISMRRTFQVCRRLSRTPRSHRRNTPTAMEGSCKAGRRPRILFLEPWQRRAHQQLVDAQKRGHRCTGQCGADHRAQSLRQWHRL